MSDALIMCGALAREVLDIIDRHGWDVDVVGVPALVHMTPEKIAPAVEKHFQALRARYDRIFVVFGDCGSRGAVDDLLARYDIKRIDGPHCYEFYGGELFTELMEEEPGTFFLTDFLVRGFHGLVVKGLGLDRFPQLKGEYFRNYRRVVYLIQKEDPELLRRAEKVAAYLELPLETRHTGYGLLEERLVALIEGE